MKMKQTFKKRLVSGLLALVMVLGFLPANLFPAASAVNTEIDGGNGGWCIDNNNVGSLKLNIDQTGGYTLTFTPNYTAGNVRLNYAIIPTFNPGRTSIKSVIGTSRFNSTNVNYMMVESSSRVYSPSAAISAYGGINANLTSGSPVTVASGQLAGGNLWNILEGSYASSKENGGYEYIVVFNNSTDSALQWAYAKVAPPGITANPNPVRVVYNADGKWEINGTEGVYGDSPTVTITLSNATGSSFFIDNKTGVTTGSFFGDNGVDASSFTFDADEVPAGGSITLTVDLTGIVDAGLSGNDTILIPYLDASDNDQEPLAIPFTINNESGWEITHINQDTQIGQPVTGTIVWKGGEDTFTPAGVIGLGDGSAFAAYPNEVAFKVSTMRGGVLTDVTDETVDLTNGMEFTVEFTTATSLSVADSPVLDTFTFATDNDAIMGVMNIRLTLSEATNYNVDFNLNGAPGTAPSSQSIPAGGTVTNPGNPSWDANNSFDGWYTAASGGDKWNFDSDTVNSDMTLWAHWTAKVTVTFVENKPNGAGSSWANPPAAQTINKGSSAKWPSPTPTLAGYTLKGWSTTAGGAVVWSSGDSPAVNSNTDYYAQWEPKEITFDEVIFSGKQNAVPTLSPSSPGKGYAVSDDHTSPGTGSDEDFTYKFSSSSTGPWTATYADTGTNGTGLTFKIVNGTITTTDTIQTAKKIEFYVQATSKLNGATKVAKVTLQVPPRVTGGSINENTIQANKTVTLKELTLTDGTKVSSAAGDVAPSHITTLEWWVGQGGVKVAGTNASNLGPTVKGKVSDAGNGDNSWTFTMPDENTAPSGMHLWVKVTGDGHDDGVDEGADQTGGGKAMWVDLGEIGKERREVRVQEVFFDTANSKLSTTSVSGISSSVSLSQVGSGERSELRTTNTNRGYEFLGWSLTGTSATVGVSNDRLSWPNTTNTNWTVQGEGNAHTATGRNNAAFEMKSLPTSTDTIVVYAVYRQVQSYNVTVTHDGNISEVKAQVGGTNRTDSTSVTISAQYEDTVTLTATPANNCNSNSYTVTLTGSGAAAVEGRDYEQIGSSTSSLILHPKANITVTFHATPVADLRITGEQHYTSAVSGTTAVTSPSAIFTATLTNPGALDAIINGGDSGLYDDRNGTKLNPTSTSCDFTISTVPGTVAHGTTNTGSAPKVTVTPKAGLSVGEHTVWLRIHESTTANQTKSGTPLDYWQQITFVVTDSQTFDGKVKVNLDGAAQSGQTVELRTSGGQTVGTTYQSSGVDAGKYVTTGSPLQINVTYSVYVNNVNSGYVIHAAAKEQEVNLYTLTTNVTPAVTNGTNAIRVTVSQSSGVTLTVGGKTAYTSGSVLNLSVPRNASLSSQAYVFDKWSGDATAPLDAISTNVTMSGAKTVTANYAASVSVIYQSNYGSAGVFYTDSGHKNGEAVTLLTGGPSRPGYDFKGWGTTSTATTAVTSVTMGTTDTTVYAIWEKAEASWSTLPSGEYGRDYTGNAVVTSGNLGAVTYSVGAWDNSLGSIGSVTPISRLEDIGLKMQTSTGMIGNGTGGSAKPTKAGTFGFSVTASNGSETWKKNYVLTIGKATPTITGVRFTTAAAGGIVDGMNVSNLQISAVVTAPYWNGSAWEDNKAYTYTNGAPSPINPGAITLTNPTGNLSFTGGNSSIQADVSFAPGTGATSNGQTFADIYNSAAGKGYINEGNQIYSFTATTPIAFDSVTTDATQSAISGTTPKTLTVTNTGNQTGTFSYTLEKMENGSYSTYASGDEPFTVTGTLGSMDANDTANLTVKPVGSKLAGQLGTHTMYVHIVETDAAGKVRAEDRIPVTMTITQGTFTGTVTTLLHDVGGSSSGAAGQVPGDDVKLRVLGTTNETTAVYSTANRRYEAAGLTVGTTYSVWINGIQVPGKYVTYTDTGTTADLYEVELAFTPVGSPAPSLTGGGYYLENQSVAINAAGTETVSGATYKFEKWTTNDLATKEFLGAAAGFAMPAKPVTMTANYKAPDALTYSVTYSAGAGVTGVQVPVNTSEYAAGATVPVSPMTPVRTGYTFGGWTWSGGTTLQPDGSFIMPAAPVVLTAVWTPVTGLEWTYSLPTGTYGSSYYGSVALKDTSKTGPVTYSSNDLPGGLTMAANGTITGKPYVVGPNQPFTVTATSTTDTSLSWTYSDGKITVNKATPTLVVTSTNNSGLIVGDPFNKATYTVAVKVPNLTTRGSTPAGDVWNDVTYTYTTTSNNANVTNTQGKLEIASGSFASGANSVKLDWTPATTGSADGNSNVYNAIYNDGTVNAIVGLDATFGITATPIANTWTVEKDYTIGTTVDNGTVTGNAANPLKVTVANTGNKTTGHLTLTWGSSSGAFEVWSDATGGSPLTGIVPLDPAPTNTKDIYIRPVAGKAPDVYTDTLTITDDDTNVSTEVRLTLVVQQASTFDFTVNTFLSSWNGSAVNRAQGDVESIVLRAAGETDVAPTTHAASSGSYTWNGLDSSKSYSVVVNGYVTTNVVTISTQSPMEVELYRAVLAQDPAATGATLTLEKADGSTVGGTAGYYYVVGQTFGVSTTVPPQKSFVNWTETHHGSSSPAVTDRVRSTSEKINYVMPAYPVTLTAHFDDIVEYVIQLGNIGTTDGLSTMTYSAGQGYRNILTGGTDGGSVYKVRAGATFGLPQPVTGTIGAGQYSITHNHSTGSYTFRGWTTAPGNTTTAAAGAFVFTANEAADQADGNDDNVITLYPVWTQDSELALSAGVIKGVYKHSTLTPNHTETATGGTGSTPAYTYSTGTLPFGITMTSGGIFETSSGVPNDTGAKTAVITVTDGTFNATADYSFVIDKANVVPDGTNGLPTNNSIAVDNMDEAHVKALFGSTVMNGDGTGENGVNGSWAVKTGHTLPTTPGTYAIPVVFTPENKNGATTGVDAYGKHYNPYETTITVEVTAKLITAADIKVVEPETGHTPENTTNVAGKTSHGLTSSDNNAAYTTDVVITNVVWSPSDDPFKASTPYTVTVTLKIADNSKYRFDVEHFAGQINTKNATKISTTADAATFSYTFSAEDIAIDTINVNTTSPAEGASSTTWSVNVQDAAKYYVDSATKWVATVGGADVTGAAPFVTDTLYDAIVVVKAQDGYVFSDTVFNGNQGTVITSVAKINNGNAPESPQNAKIEVSLASDKKTLTIRYSAFKPEKMQVVGIYVTGTPGAYYAQTDATAKHHDGNATGDNGAGFAFDKSQIQVYPVYDDGTRGSTPIASSDWSIVKLSDSVSMPASFQQYGGIDHEADWDGQTLAVYWKGTNTPVPGILTVKPLTADGISLTGTVTTDYTSSKTFTAAATATVSFNTGTALANTESALSAGAKPTSVTDAAATGDNRTTFYYMLDANSDGKITDADTALVSGTTAITADMHNKDIYACYTDVNGHLVYTKVGTVKTSVEFTVGITDENGHDPEYGDRLTATPDAGDPSDYTYQWQVQDGGNWVNIPGAVGKDYVPTSDKIGKTVKVVVTDKATGTAVDGTHITGTNPIVIQKRSVNFTVASIDKTEDGNKLNNFRAYVSDDFTLKVVGTYGGVMPADQGKVTLTLKAALNVPGTESVTGAAVYQQRPMYASAAPNSTITWPGIAKDDSTVATDKTGGYEFGGDSANYYRLAAQGEQTPRGVIIAKGKTSVSHVDVSFKEVPTYDHEVPGNPMAVTDTRETLPGEDGGTNFVATWYTDFNTGTLTGTPVTAGSKFGADTYTVVVKVKPNAAGNYIYDSNTKFNFHFGESSHEEVTPAVNGEVRTMYYTFPAVDQPKIAHVNVSVPQPVVYGTPANGTVNQALGTDGTELKANITNYGNLPIIWKDSANNTPTSFIAGETYTAEFDLIVANSYLYLNGTDKVDFTVSGVGPIEGANHIGDNTTPANTVITSVTTSTTDANTTYHVVVVYETIQGGKVDLSDVFVNASVPGEGVVLTGPTVDSGKPYGLTGGTTVNKWQYWNGTAWADASNGTGLSADGKFLAGYDYKVMATVNQTDASHYQITTGTKFYLAGLECTTTAETGKHGSYTPLVPSAAAGADNKYADTVTFTLTKEFSIPANAVGLITVTYVDPMAGKAPNNSPTYSIMDQVDLTGTGWTVLATQSAPATAANFTGNTFTGNFTDGTFYLAQSTVSPKAGYALSAATLVNINGILVPADGATVGKKLDAESKEIGWALATYDNGTGNITVKYVAKTAAVDRIIVEVTTNVTAPVAGAAPAGTTSTTSALNGEGRDVKSQGMTGSGDVNITWSPTGNPFAMATAYTAKFTLTTQGQYTFKDDADNSKRVVFSVNGIKVTGEGTTTSGGVTVTTKKNSDTSYDVTVTFPETSDKTPITAVSVTYTEPVIGGQPAASVSYTPTAQVALGAAANDNLLVTNKSAGTTWFSGEPANIGALGSSGFTGTFAPGKYTVYANFTALGNTKFDTDTTFTVNGTTYAGNSDHVHIGTDGATAQVCHTFTVSGTIVRVAANVAQPVVGTPIVNAVTKILAQTENGIDVKDTGLTGTTINAAWQVSSDKTTWGTPGANFEAGKYYKATFTVSANTTSGYSFLADGTDNVDFLVNSVGWINGGDNADQNGINVETAQDGGTNSYTITVTFPMTGATADILTVWGNAKEPVAGGTINHGDITVSPAEPYAIKSNTNKWYTDAACTTEATGTFQPGTTYYARLTVELKSAYTGLYQFAADTKGYINDTAGGTTVTYDPTTGTPTTITLTRAFPVPATSTDMVVYGNVVEPTATTTASANNITAINGQPYEKVSARWLDDAGNPFTSQFQPGKTYTAELVVKVKDAYAYTHSLTNATEGYLNNSAVTGGYKVFDNGDGTLTLKKDFHLEDSSITKVVVNSATPTPGSALPDSINPGDSSKYTFENESWAATDGTPTTTVEYSKSYTMTVTVRPKDDTINLPGTDTSGYTWNGRTASSAKDNGDGTYTVTFEYTTGPKPADPVPPSPGGTTTVELPVVTYWISDHGFTNDLTAEKMSRSGAKPTFTPKVSGKEGYTFKGWSEKDPATLKQGEEIKLVDPLTFSISADKTFYAVYDEPRFEHDHYVSGYPDGTFKPEQYITRAEVAAIVANACLDGFDNNENYGNPGNYSDINPKKWYGNDIAYCTMYGVFSGYKDGTFKPDQYITRQELAVVVANMAGMQTNIGMPFTDATSINKWARDGVYTVYKNNWVSGYPDGTFRPQNNITRAETVAIFNGYLHRGVDADGLAELTPYVLNAAAGGYEGDGSSLYMTWTDVPEKYWAYYHIIEAANDHDYHWADEETKLPPEHWDAAYIDQEWRYREEFPVTYVVGDHGTAPDGSVLNLSVKSGGRPRTQPHIDPNTDWTFLGWSLTPTGDIVEPLTVTITGETTFYAVYAPKATTYTVRYDAGTDGAVSGASSESVIEGQTPAHVPAVNAHEGYSFLGWAETLNGTVVDPTGVAITADKTFYAVYRADQPDVQLQSHTAYMSGYDDGTFRPSQAITRADVVTMVVRALGTDYDPDRVYDTSSVSDVEGHPAQNMIGYCIEKGIFSGYKDGTFLPEGTMTRQEFAVVIANLAGGAQENQGLPFTDADSVNKWARNAVYTVYSNGWIGGYKDGSFQPKNNITRAEAAVIFNGFLGRNVNKTSLTDVSVGASSPWSDVKATNWAYQNIMEATSDHSFYLDGEVEHWAEP